MIGALVYAVGGFIEFLLVMRFILQLAGANVANAFVQWIYSWSTPFVTPFAGIFGQHATITGHGAVTTSVFDWTALIALVIIGLIVGVVGRALASI